MIFTHSFILHPMLYFPVTSQLLCPGFSLFLILQSIMTFILKKIYLFISVHLNIPGIYTIKIKLFSGV